LSRACTARPCRPASRTSKPVFRTRLLVTAAGLHQSATRSVASARRNDTRVNPSRQAREKPAPRFPHRSAWSTHHCNSTIPRQGERRSRPAAAPVVESPVAAKTASSFARPSLWATATDRREFSVAHPCHKLRQRFQYSVLWHCFGPRVPSFSTDYRLTLSYSTAGPPSSGDAVGEIQGASAATGRLAHCCDDCRAAQAGRRGSPVRTRSCQRMRHVRRARQPILRS